MDQLDLSRETKYSLLKDRIVALEIPAHFPENFLDGHPDDVDIDKLTFDYPTLITDGTEGHGGGGGDVGDGHVDGGKKASWIEVTHGGHVGMGRLGHGGGKTKTVGRRLSDVERRHLVLIGI